MDSCRKALIIYNINKSSIVSSRDVFLVNKEDCDFRLEEPVDLVEDNDDIDMTNCIDDSVSTYTDGTLNHIIKEIIGVEDTDDSSSNLNEANQDGNSTEFYSGQIVQFNKSQRAHFESNFDNHGFTLQFQRPVKTKGNGKCSIYKVLSVSVPSDFYFAINSPESEQWSAAMLLEMEQMRKNNTWTLVPKPQNVQIIPGMWVYSVKHAPDLSIEKYKALFVAKGYAHKSTFDTYSPVLRSSSFNILMSLAVFLNMKVFQLDVKTAYLNATLKEDVYMKQPISFEDQEHPHYVCKLNRSIYGLDSSAVNWFNFITNLILEYDFLRIKQIYSDRCIFRSECNSIIIGLYVDDLVILSKAPEVFYSFRDYLAKHVELTDKDLMQQCLGINVIQSNSKILIHQSDSILSILKESNLVECNPAKTPMMESINLEDSTSPSFNNSTYYRRILGMVLYIAVHSRPDICFAVTRLCRFISNPLCIHFDAVKHLLRYLKGTIDLKMKFTKHSPTITQRAEGTQNTVDGYALYIIVFRIKNWI